MKSRPRIRYSLALAIALSAVSAPMSLLADEPVPAAAAPAGGPATATVAQPELAANASAAAAPAPVDPAVARMIADLASPEFSKRQDAVVGLKEATEDQITQMSVALQTQTDNEVIRRLIEIFEKRYEAASLDSTEVRVASDALEWSAKADRWFVSEAARDVLDRHWQRRTEIAVIELKAMNVSLSPADPTILWQPDANADQGPFGQMNPTSAQHLKIFVDKAWPSDARAFDLLRRLDSLRSGSFMTQRRMVSIYLIDGHPLALEQIAILKGIFGDTGIAERGRVCLGVMNEPRFGAGEGILVGNVQAASSADDAGIVSGDLIIAMNGEKLSDFDQLVTKLKKFDVGDKIKLSVRSFRFPGNEGVEEVEVTLKGWN